MAPIHTNVSIPTLCVHSPLDSNAKLNYTYRNKLTNGSFDIWQRSINSDLSVAAYVADRWLVDLIGNVSRQQFVGGESELMDNARFYLKTVPAGSTPASIEQRIEGVRTLAGKQATLTFWAKCGIPDSEMVLTITQCFGTTDDVSVQADVSESIGTAELLTVWRKHTFSFEVPSIASKTIGQDGNDYLKIRFALPVDDISLCNVQLEEGALATDFEQRPVDEELRLCKRFYEQINVNQDQYVLNGIGLSGTQAVFIIPYQTKRSVPVITIPDSDVRLFDISEVPIWSMGESNDSIGNCFATVESGIVQGSIVCAYGYTDSAITIDAEL